MKIKHEQQQGVAGTNAGGNPAATLVNVLAWSFIGLSALSLLLAAVLYTLFAHVLPMEPLRAALADAIRVKLLPPSALQFLQHLPSVAMALFAVSLPTLLVSMALLKRRHWARIVFAWIMIATALAHLAGLLLPFYFTHDFSAALNDMPPELRGAATAVMKMITTVSIVMGVAFAGGFAWVAKRLFSTEIAREFGASNDAHVNGALPK